MYLIFTSAGDNCQTLDGIWNSHPNKIKFDIYTVFYGDNKEKANQLKERSKYFLKLKGGKFENLVRVYQQYKNILLKYKYIFVLDNDIIINTLEINLLFKIAYNLDFALISPAFKNDDNGKISHEITKQIENCYYRITNFVEMGTMLFRRRDLFNFLDYLISLNQPILKGWGMDYVILHYLKGKQIGIIDCIGCINPKTKEREIDKLQCTKDRRKDWSTLSDKLNIPEIKDKRNIYILKEIPLYILKELEIINSINHLE